MKRTVLLLLYLVLTTAACTHRAAPSPTLPELPPTARGDVLARGIWTVSGETYLLHHAGHVEIGNERLPLNGVLLLDTRARVARVQAIGVFGLTLFAMEITQQGARSLGACPLFKRFPSLERHVPNTVRSLFLGPLPETGDGYLLDGPRVRLRGPRDGGVLTGGFDAATGDLLQTTFQGPNKRWTAEYSDYRTVGVTRIPFTVRFADAEAGYAVELNLQDLEIH